MTKNIAQLSFYNLALGFLFLPISIPLCGVFIAISLILMCLQIHKYCWDFLHKPFILILIAFLATLAYGLTYSLTKSATLHYLNLYGQLALIIVLIPILMKFSKHTAMLPKLYVWGCIISTILLIAQHAPSHSAMPLCFGAYLAYALSKNHQGKLNGCYRASAVILLIGALYAAGALHSWQINFTHLKDENILNAQNALKLWQAAPIIGHGTGSFVAAYFNNQLLPTKYFLYFINKQWHFRFSFVLGNADLFTAECVFAKEY